MNLTQYKNSPKLTKVKKTLNLVAVKQQLEYALNEVKKKRSDKNLLHDYITDSLNRINDNLTR